MSAARRARVRALAKINLGLRVLGKRPDGYHELRTVYHTVSLADTLEIAYTPGGPPQVEIDGAPEIPDNLAARAARLLLESSGAGGRVALRLAKRIPMGAGLGGGSSDAAAVLLALPALAGIPAAMDERLRMAAGLGSDVPFFLLGGCALGMGRGSEIYPLPDVAGRHGLLLAPGIHASTPDAYRALSPRLTSESVENKIVSFQSQTWGLIQAGVCAAGANDFEPVVFEQFPPLASLRRRLEDLGAAPARMSGSGSALFGFFRTREELSRALNSIREVPVFPISLVSRAQYRALWWRWLGPHINRKIWPPPSRYEQ